MRLHELTPEQLHEWRRERRDAGREKYGDSHLERYNLVDVMEELLDAVNIVKLLQHRLDCAGFELTPEYHAATDDVAHGIAYAVQAVVNLDRLLPDELCTDERGGDRIWWSEQAGFLRGVGRV